MSAYNMEDLIELLDRLVRYTNQEIELNIVQWLDTYVIRIDVWLLDRQIVDITNVFDALGARNRLDKSGIHTLVSTLRARGSNRGEKFLVNKYLQAYKSYWI